MTAWWLPDDCLMTEWWLPDEWTMTSHFYFEHTLLCSTVQSISKCISKNDCQSKVSARLDNIDIRHYKIFGRLKIYFEFTSWSLSCSIKGQSLAGRHIGLFREARNTTRNSRKFNLIGNLIYFTRIKLQFCYNLFHVQMPRQSSGIIRQLN